MKKVLSISVVIALLMLSLLALNSGTVRAGDTVTSPHFAATVTPTPAQGKIPITGGGPAATATPSRTIPITGSTPGTIPITGGAPDSSGSILLIGAGALLVIGGLVLYGRRRTQA